MKYLILGLLSLSATSFNAVSADYDHEFYHGLTVVEKLAEEVNNVPRWYRHVYHMEIVKHLPTDLLRKVYIAEITK